MRTLFLIVALLCLALPASALDLTKPRLLIDSTCTDAFNVPATTDGTDLTARANWDSTGEATDPDTNLNDAVQISGSSDGWCDDAPWVIAGVATSFPDDGDLYIGPLRVGPAGMLFMSQMDTVVTTWSWDIMLSVPWTGSVDTLFTMSDQSSTAVFLTPFGPNIEQSSQIPSGLDAGLFPIGAEMYIRIDLNGTGAWDVNLQSFPLRNDDSTQSR